MAGFDNGKRDRSVSPLPCSSSPTSYASPLAKACASLQQEIHRSNVLREMKDGYDVIRVSEAQPLGARRATPTGGGERGRLDVAAGEFGLLHLRFVSERTSMSPPRSASPPRTMTRINGSPIRGATAATASSRGASATSSPPQDEPTAISIPLVDIVAVARRRGRNSVRAVHRFSPSPSAANSRSPERRSPLPAARRGAEDFDPSGVDAVNLSGSGRGFGFGGLGNRSPGLGNSNHSANGNSNTGSSGSGGRGLGAGGISGATNGGAGASAALGAGGSAASGGGGEAASEELLCIYLSSGQSVTLKAARATDDLQAVADGIAVLRRTPAGAAAATMDDNGEADGNAAGGNGGSFGGISNIGGGGRSSSGTDGSARG
ncbi:unnamed protein product, partial [Phaeothamnion confervicola]